MPHTASPKSGDAGAESVLVIDELIDTVASGGAKDRLRILQRVTDLFVAGSRSYSRQQVALFDDVLQRLAADIEIKARARLAHQLAGVDNAPIRLMRSLAFDDAIEVAGPVLVQFEQLSDADLVENASTKSQDHLYAIAQRLKLSECVTDVLVERGNDIVVRKVAKNKGARFSLAGYDKLTTRAQRDRRLTLILGQRSDIPRQYFLKLLETASATVRARLEEANPTPSTMSPPPCSARRARLRMNSLPRRAAPCAAFGAPRSPKPMSMRQRMPRNSSARRSRWRSSAAFRLIWSNAPCSTRATA